MADRLDEGLKRAEALEVGHGYAEAGITASKLTPVDVFAEAGWHLAPRVTAFARGDWTPLQRETWSAVAGVRVNW